MTGKLPTKPKQCASCKSEAPGTQTDYTLIGQKHGWRVAKEVGTDGKPMLAWYCAECWPARTNRSRALG